MAHNRRPYGGRPGGPAGNHMNVSPWEGGVVPGTGRPASAGILGAAPQPVSLLSQLTSQEAQLALASNLLSTLLGQQQQQQTHVAPQPLLSLGTTGPGPNLFGRPEGLKHQLGPMRQRGHNARFPDMYNKQRDMQGRRPLNYKRGPTGPTRGARKIQTSRDEKNGVAGKIKKDSPADEKKVEAGKSVKEEGVKKEDKDDAEKSPDEQGIKKDDVEKDLNEIKEEEEDEEGEEKKRGWKDEKNKKDDVDAENVDESKNEKGGEEEKNSAEEPKTDTSRYSDVPKDLLVCHICNKNMWDGQSFENHLRGKSHQMMMDQTEKSYKIQVKLMRQELKLAEEKREIEMERIQRLGKKVNIKAREYCTMCDLYFFGNIMGHRKNQLHQNLKNFLHPRCTLCTQEFPSRTEWDHHQLTPMHLLKLAETRKAEALEPRALVVEDTPEESSGIDGELLNQEGLDESSQMNEDNDGQPGVDEAGAGAKAAGENQDKGSNESNEKEPSTNAVAKKQLNRNVHLPPYDPKKVYGVQLLKKVVGYTCDVCNRFFFQHKEALAHCQTTAHYKSYMSYLTKGGRQEASQKKDSNVRENVQDGEQHKKRPRTEGELKEAVENSNTEGAQGDESAEKLAQEQSADSTTENEAAADKGNEQVEAHDGQGEKVVAYEEGTEPTNEDSGSEKQMQLDEEDGDQDLMETSTDTDEEKGEKKGGGVDSPKFAMPSTPLRKGMRRGTGRGRGHRKK